MDLILWRHAEAEDGTPDTARNLTAKGRKQARTVAGWMKRRIEAPVQVLASPAARAQQTALAYTEHVETRKELSPGAAPAAVLRAAGWPGGTATVLVVGHQPALGAAAALALTGKALPWDVKKGAAWWLRAEEGRAPLVVAVITPKLARASRRPR